MEFVISLENQLLKEDHNTIHDELKLFLCVVFYSEPNQISGVKFFLFIIHLVYLVMYYCCCKNSPWFKPMTYFAANSGTKNSILDVCLGSGCASADWSKLFLLFWVLWRLFLCHGKFVTKFYSEIPFAGISLKSYLRNLIETIQFILVCEFVFALLEFYWEDFTNGLKLICLLISTVELRFQKFFGNTYKGIHFLWPTLLWKKPSDVVSENLNCLTLIDTVYCLHRASCFLGFCCSYGNYSLIFMRLTGLFSQ